MKYLLFHSKRKYSKVTGQLVFIAFEFKEHYQIYLPVFSCIFLIAYG